MSKNFSEKNTKKTPIIGATQKLIKTRNLNEIKITFNYIIYSIRIFNFIWTIAHQALISTCYSNGGISGQWTSMPTGRPGQVMRVVVTMPTQFMGGMIPLLGAGAPTCCKGGELRQSILLLRQRRRWAARAVLVSLLKEEWEDEEQEGKKGKFASEWKQAAYIAASRVPEIVQIRMVAFYW